MPRPNTPGVLGYLLAYATSVGVFGLLVGEWTLGGPGDEAVSWLGVAFFAAAATGVVGVPIGLVLIPVVHLWCRDVEEQSAHVVAAGLAGLIGCLGVALLMEGGSGDGQSIRIVLAGGLATAAGRAAVIPLVTRRRTRVAS